MNPLPTNKDPSNNNNNTNNNKIKNIIIYYLKKFVKIYSIIFGICFIIYSIAVIMLAVSEVTCFYDVNYNYHRTVVLNYDSNKRNNLRSFSNFDICFDNENSTSYSPMLSELDVLYERSYCYTDGKAFLWYKLTCTEHYSSNDSVSDPFTIKAQQLIENYNFCSLLREKNDDYGYRISRPCIILLYSYLDIVTLYNYSQVFFKFPLRFKVEKNESKNIKCNLIDKTNNQILQKFVIKIRNGKECNNNDNEDFL